MELTAYDLIPLVLKLSREERTRLFEMATALSEEAPPLAIPGLSSPPRRFGSMRGLITLADDFDAPLAPEIQRYFDGEGDDE
jgi:hypothetical protein